MRCLCCHTPLVPGEENVCLSCQTRFPLVNSGEEQNPMWARLVGLFPFEHATASSYYQRGNEYASLICMAKFGGRPRVNAYLTRLLLQQLEGSGWPYDIDLIVPVPVHWTKYLTRGYNQVGPIVQALSQHWHIPVDARCLSRRRLRRSQLRVTEMVRREVPDETFGVRHPERIEGRHILLVDDVCTTGATITACASQLLAVPGVRLSVLTLGMTLSV